MKASRNYSIVKIFKCREGCVVLLHKARSLSCCLPDGLARRLPRLEILLRDGLIPYVTRRFQLCARCTVNIVGKLEHMPGDAAEELLQILTDAPVLVDRRPARGDDQAYVEWRPLPAHTATS